MTKFFTGNPVAFYDPEICQAPKEAIEIPDALWLSLLEEQSQGKVIKADADGYPISVDPSPPSIEQRLESCKLQAKSLLLDSDWVELPSVSASENSPRLQNVAGFLTYRASLRMLAVSPVLDPIWPTKPVAEWSN